MYIRTTTIMHMNNTPKFPISKLPEMNTKFLGVLAKDWTAAQFCPCSAASPFN